MISMMTLNVRIQTFLDGPHQFKYRKQELTRRLRAEQPDVLCLQEVVGNMLDVIRAEMPGYAFAGADSKGEGRGEYTAIAYRPDTLTLAASGTFWLSSRPGKAGSRFFLQSPDPRVCTWAEFTHKESGARFRYFNTHLDHLSPIARGKGARVIFEHMAACQAREKLPLFWGGDFNFTPRAALYAECLRQTVAEGRLVDLTGAIPTTFHWFGALKRPLKLDYVFADEATAGDALSVRLVPTDAAGGFVSDHHAIRLDWDPGAPRPERPAEAPAHPWEGAPAPAL